MNQPPLGQARNVASLFERASGDKILLIHDDDLLTIDGVEKLVSLWTLHPQLDAAFGDQYEADHDGTIDFDASDASERRVPAHEGRRGSAGAAGPNRADPDVPEQWLDGERGPRQADRLSTSSTACAAISCSAPQLCLAAREVFYLHDYVSVYRKTATSISHSTRGTAIAATVSAYAVREGADAAAATGSRRAGSRCAGSRRSSCRCMRATGRRWPA